MDGSASAARLPFLNSVILIQTDTTAGFVSQNAAALAACKNRLPHKPFLKTFASLSDYKRTGRIPSAFKQEVRRSFKSTYIVKGRAFRIVADGPYHRFLRPYGWLYSTSANAAGKHFDPVFAFKRSDVIVEDERGLFEDVPSHIYKLNRSKKRRIR